MKPEPTVNPDSTQFQSETPAAVRRALETCRKTQPVIRLWLGDPATGRSWLEEYDTIGRVGRSMGPVKVPLLVPEGEAGGGAISTDHVIRIRDEGTRKDLYRHPQFHLPELTVVADVFYASGTHAVLQEGKVYSRHRSYAAAAGLIAWLAGEEYIPSRD